MINIQNPVISEIATRIRIVVPLVKIEDFKDESMSKLILELEFIGEKFIFLTPQIASNPTRLLTTSIGTIEQLRDEIISTLDFVIKGI